MQSFINQQHTKDASPPPFFRDSNKLLVCLLRAVNVSFHICIKMLLSKLLGRTGDKVIHVISPPDLASVSEFLGKKKYSVTWKERVSLSGGARASNESVDLRKVGRDCNRKRGRESWEVGCLGVHRFEFRGDESATDWVNPTGLSHPILSSTEQDRAEDQKGCEYSHMLLANSLSLMIWKRGLG